MYLRISRAKEKGTFSFSLPGTPDPVKKISAFRSFVMNFWKKFFKIFCVTGHEKNKCSKLSGTGSGLLAMRQKVHLFSAFWTK
jgi:hypothetical protein